MAWNKTEGPKSSRLLLPIERTNSEDVKSITNGNATTSNAVLQVDGHIKSGATLDAMDLSDSKTPIKHASELDSGATEDNTSQNSTQECSERRCAPGRAGV